MVNTRAQAESLVAACRYAPDGDRSWGPTRAILKDRSSLQGTATPGPRVSIVIGVPQELDGL